MDHVERFRAVMNLQSVDRLPRWEWAMWWDETIANWRQQGLPAELESVFDIAEYFGLDPYQQFWFSTTDDTIEAVQHHVEGVVSNMDDYLRLRGNFYPDHSRAIESMQPWAERQARGEVVMWVTLEGYYRKIIPRLLEKDIIPLVDTDGDVTMMVPWLLREGIRGVLPLERQAGVDGMDLRRPSRNSVWWDTSIRWSWTRARRRCGPNSSVYCRSQDPAASFPASTTRRHHT